MAQSNFKVGDLVSLKSGDSPVMTIKEIITSEFLVFDGERQLPVNKVIVNWFDKNKTVQSAEFTEPQLEIAQ